MICSHCAIRPEEITLSTASVHYTLCAVCAVSLGNRVQWVTPVVETYKEAELLESMWRGAVCAHGEGTS